MIYPFFFAGIGPLLVTNHVQKIVSCFIVKKRKEKRALSSHGCIEYLSTYNCYETG